MTSFNLASVGFAWLPILPLIAISIGAMIVLVAGVRLATKTAPASASSPWSHCW